MNSFEELNQTYAYDTHTRRERDYIFIRQIKRQANYVDKVPLNHSNTTELFPSLG